MVFCIYRIYILRKKGAVNKRILNVLSDFKEKEKFKQALLKEMSEENDEVVNARLRALEVWGGAYHGDEELFFDGLNNLDLSLLIHPENPQTKVGENESVFFWLLLFAPNNLFSKHNEEWMNDIYTKIEEWREELKDEMVWVVSQANRLFYEKKKDLGKSTYDRILEGDYEDLFYTKDMIGFYKGIVTAMRAKLYYDEGDIDNYNFTKDTLGEFVKVPLGERWIQEIDLPFELESEEE